MKKQAEPAKAEYQLTAQGWAYLFVRRYTAKGVIDPLTMKRLTDVIQKAMGSSRQEAIETATSGSAN